MKTIREMLDDSLCSSFERFVEGLYNQKIDVDGRLRVWLQFWNIIGHPFRVFVLRLVENVLKEKLK